LDFSFDSHVSLLSGPVHSLRLPHRLPQPVHQLQVLHLHQTHAPTISCTKDSECMQWNWFRWYHHL
jgi:hypothetical protein